MIPFLCLAKLEKTLRKINVFAENRNFFVCMFFRNILLKIRSPRIVSILFLCITLVHGSPLFAGAVQSDTVKVPFKDRVALHANAVDWLLQTPAIGMEYSFIQNDYNKISFLLHAKYNPNSSTKFKPGYIYNIIGVRPEVRWYFRTREYFDTERQLNELESFWRRLLTRPYSLFAKDNPRRHRAYYIGPYVSFDKYTIKLGSTGYQGHSFGFGATVGYSIPLYQYKDGSAIDFELGFSAGFAFATHDKFRYDTDGACYAYEGNRGMGIVPFPVVSDVRVAFVYRLNSIRNQIQKIDHSRLEKDSTIYELRKLYNDKNKEYIFSGIPEDSISKWNSVIRKRNHEIREINRRALKELGVDSAMLLQEYAEYYPYITIPEKYFSKYNTMLPNKDITSVSELKNRFLNELLEAYSGIKPTNWKSFVGDELTVENLDARLTTLYMTGERARKVNDGDTISGIRFIQSLVNAVPDVNGQVIKMHNTIYHSTGFDVDSEKYDSVSASTKMALGAKTVVPQTTFTGKVSSRTIVFVEGLDSVYIKTVKKQKPYTRNSIIEADNIVKRVALDKMFADNAKKVAVTKADNGTEKKSRKRRWMFWKKKSRDVAPVDTLSTAPVKIPAIDTVPVDSVSVRTEVIKSDTLQIDTLGVEPLLTPMFLY